MHPIGLLDELGQRGLITQSTDRDAFERHLATEQRVVYCGFDPTAESLHVGHLLMLTLLARFQRRGHRVIALIGGGTAQIGDPSFKAQEREINPIQCVEKWSDCFYQQIAGLLQRAGEKPQNFELANNCEWLQSLDLLTFLREVGKAFSVNALLKRQAIADRLARADRGISYAEFSYPLLQAYDFLKLYESRRVTIQIGGSDQWGNLVAGMDLIRDKHRYADIHGLTVPLLLKASGEKFGKTEQGAVWLDPRKTSPYAFFQFWYQIPDAQVMQLLQQLTFLPCDLLEQWGAEQAAGSLAPNELQTTLAHTMTAFVHGESVLPAINRIRACFFQEAYQHLSASDFDQLVTGGTPLVQLPSDWCGRWIELLTLTELVTSRRHIRELASQNALFVNGQPLSINALDQKVDPEHYYHGKYLVLRRGKKNHLLVAKIGT